MDLRLCEEMSEEWAAADRHKEGAEKEVKNVENERSELLALQGQRHRDIKGKGEKLDDMRQDLGKLSEYTRELREQSLLKAMRLEFLVIEKFVETRCELRQMAKEFRDRLDKLEARTDPQRSLGERVSPFSDAPPGGAATGRGRSKLLQCYNCCGEGHFSRDCREPKRKKCAYCGKSNHDYSICARRARGGNRENQPQDDEPGQRAGN